MRKARCLVCDNQFARQHRPWQDARHTLWSLRCTGCGAVFVDPDEPLVQDEVEHPREAAWLDGDFRAFRLALGSMMAQGRVLLVSDPLDQRPQMAFGPGVQQQTIAWTSLEAPWLATRQLPRDTPLPPQVHGPFDWVVWWHGLEHTRRPAAHLLTLAKVATQGLWVGLPPWPRTPWGRVAALRRWLPQHRFAAGPGQARALAQGVHLLGEGPFAPASLQSPATARHRRWLYRLTKDPALWGGQTP